jgi:hypothetical protein
VSRHIAVSEARTTRAYRVVRITRDPENGEATRYIGLFDTVAPARGLVTKMRKAWDTCRITTLNPFVGRRDYEDPTELVDAWVEPVTVTNHPGVRYEDGWTAPEDDTRERLHAVSAIASVLEDEPEDPWKHAYAIRRLADGDFTVAQAREWLGEGWESL